MKTNYMIPVKAPVQWKAPWRMPVGNTQVKAEVPIKNGVLSVIQHKFDNTVKELQDIFQKHWSHD